MHMRSVAPIRTAKIGYIVISVMLCVLGIILLVVPDFSAFALGVICGVTFIIFGCVRLTGYFSKDLYRLAFQYDLAFGIILLAMGIFILTQPNNVMKFISVSLGIFILADGLFKIQIAFDSKHFGISVWWLILVLAILSGICGLMLMFNPDKSSSILMIMLGISLLSEGILSLCTVITAVKIIKHQKPDVIEIDCYEERED